eukprot:Skav233094  [mRNA]  locus=scaffold3948:72868:75737:- [translate_table: standard]
MDAVPTAALARPRASGLVHRDAAFLVPRWQTHRATSRYLLPLVAMAATRTSRRRHLPLAFSVFATTAVSPPARAEECEGSDGPTRCGRHGTLVPQRMNTDLLEGTVYVQMSLFI